MDWIKKNYEKVILGVVLVGLVAAAFFLYLRVDSERSFLVEVETLDPRRQKVELPPVDLSTNEAVLRRLRRPGTTDLSSDHNIFNPVQWQKTTDGVLRKIVSSADWGPGALTINKLSPLHTIVTYEGSSGSGDQVLHRFKVTREAEEKVADRRPMTMQSSGEGAKNQLFTLTDIRPSAQDPREFVLEMADGKQQITISRDNPYQGISGYTADLEYKPDRTLFLNKRVGDRLVFANDTNKIVSITSDSVTVEALSNKKRVTITASKASAAPASASR
jgi:hypothetical protein